jgi:hypothetical protein
MIHAPFTKPVKRGRPLTTRSRSELTSYERLVSPADWDLCRKKTSYDRTHGRGEKMVSPADSKVHGSMPRHNRSGGRLPALSSRMWILCLAQDVPKLIVAKCCT